MNATAKQQPKKTPKAQPLNGDLLPNLEGPALRFIALDAIEAKGQVRTEFNEPSIADLAEDIKTRGMLQAVLLRPSLDGNKYIIIAGERRIRAARLAGLAAVPAIVGEVSESQAADMQLAENIQREDLSLKDVAAAVRRLYDREGKIDKVTQIVKKSKSWVSKHLSVSCPDFGYQARQMLEQGVTDDLELLTTLNALYKIDYETAQQLGNKIRAGKAGRKEARDLLAKAKKEAEEHQAELAKEKSAQPKQKKKKDEPPPFYPGNTLHAVIDILQEENPPMIAEVLGKFDDKQKQLMLDIAADAHQRGHLVMDLQPIDKMRRLMAYQTSENYVDDIDNTAFLMGAFGIEFTLENLLNEQQRILRI
jgi:ParB/RepB/Spo0J family partition protein